MKNLLFILALLTGSALAQGVRYDIPPILGARGTPLPNVQVQLCSGTATITGTSCAPQTQSFTDITNVTQCTLGSPVTLANSNTCQGTSDVFGNAGFWLSPGAYIYCLTGPSVTGQCYNLTVPAGVTSAGVTSVPSLTVSGAVTANSIASLGSVVYCDAQTGSDIGAKCNAAYAAAGCGATKYCTIRISGPGPSSTTVNLPTGSITLPTWTYSTDMIFGTPVNLECAPGVWLNYTGSGKAIKQGADGVVAGARNPEPYIVNGCGFTGGASMTHGIYHNKFVVKSYVRNVTMINFGNSTAFNIFYQAENWVSDLQNVYMWAESSGPCYNGINVNDVDGSGTYDFGDSFVRFMGLHLQSLNTACTTTGIIVNSLKPEFKHVDVAGGFSTLVRLRKGATGAVFDDFYGETINTGAGVNGIVYGDVNTDPAANVNAFIDSMQIHHSFINVHNADALATTAHAIAPATATAGLQNALLDNFSVSSITNGQPVVTMNNLASQTGNCANYTRYSTGSIAFAPGLATGVNLHTAGGNITAWCGTDETLTGYGALSITGNATIGGRVATADGNAGAPAFTFSATLNDGFYRIGSSNWGFSAFGTGVINLNANGAAVVAGKVFGIESGVINSAIDTAWSRCAANVFCIGNGTPADTSGTVKTAALLSGGTAAALTGTGACATFSTQTGGALAGRATCTGATAASTLTITPGTTAPNGWVCYVQDQTTRANLLQQTATNGTTCTLTATSITQNDVIVFTAIAF